MKKIILLSFVFLQIILFSFSSEAKFIAGLEDMPILDGIEQVNEDNFSFGNEETRIVEVILQSESKNFKQLIEFYKVTLPNLGWKLEKNESNLVTFSRENELLEILDESDTKLNARLTIKSKN